MDELLNIFVVYCGLLGVIVLAGVFFDWTGADIFTLFLDPCLRQRSAAVGMLLILVAGYVAMVAYTWQDRDPAYVWLWSIPAVLGVVGVVAFTRGVMAEMAQPPGTSTTEAKGKHRVEPAPVQLAGQTGIALTALQPSGKVEVNGQRVDATTEGIFVEVGTPIEVVQAGPFSITVRPVSARS